MAEEDGRRARLTKRSVDSAAPEAARYTVWDTDLKGFGVRVAPSGTKTFVARYRVGGGRRGALRQMVIGRYGVLTPDKARRDAERALAAATRGEDPQGARQAARAELTMSELCDLYLAEGVGAKKASTVYIDRTRIQRHIKPLLGDLRVTAVDKANLDRFMRDVAEGKTKSAEAPLVRGGKPAAARAVGLLSGIFLFAIERKLRPDNPAEGVKRYADVKRERFLSPAELGVLGDTLTAMEGEGEDWRPLTIFRLLALTGARKNEIVRLRWSELDQERALIRLADSKTGAKVIPLGAAALSVFQGVGRTKSPFVFPDPRDPKQPYRGIDWAWVRVRTRAKLQDVRIHDLRHSFASAGLASGQALPLIGKLLGHTQVSTTARYAHLADDPVRAAADRISGAIAGAMEGSSAQVTRLRDIK